MIQMVDRPNTTPIGQDRETLTFKDLLYLNVVVYYWIATFYLIFKTAKYLQCIGAMKTTSTVIIICKCRVLTFSYF